MRLWRNFLVFFWHYFSVRQLIFNLLATWRRDTTGYGRGFDFKRYAETFAMNMVSRLMGLIVRLIFILTALLLEFLVLFLGFLFFVFWLGFVGLGPFFVGVGFYLLFLGDIIGAFYIIWAVLFTNIAYFAFRNDTQRPYSQMTFNELLKQRWAKRIWQGLGLAKAPGDINQLKEEITQFNLNENDLGLIFRWEIFLQQSIERKRQFWRRDVLMARPPATRNWAYGYTYHLDQYSVDLTDVYKYASQHKIIAHRHEVDKIEKILSSSGESNALLIGDPGSGKTAIVMALAKMIAQGRVVGNLAYKRVLDFKIDEALAGLPDQSAMQEKLQMLLYEAASAGNTILIIEDIDRYVSNEQGVGKMDVSSVVASFLPYPTIQVVGTTNTQAYRSCLEKNSTLMKYFERVQITEPNFDQVFMILCDVAWQIKKESKITVSYQAIKRIARLADRYFQELPMPQRAINILKDSINKAQREGKNIVLKEDIDQIASQKAGLSVGSVSQDEKEKLINLEEFLHKRVVNQQEAIVEIASAMRRRRLEIGDTKRPIGSFLFMGPTGVGKTETAKALADAYFGSEKQMIRLDMTEYKDVSAIERLLGSAEGKISGQLTSAIREKPFSLLLLDEIEKANPEVVQIFMQVLEDGFLTDGLGRKVSFKESIIIATSNAGAELIRKLVGDSDASLNEKKSQVLDYVQQKGIFRPEFINRFDSVVLYEPLSKENLFKIARLMLNSLAGRLQAQKLIFEFGDDLIQKVAELGYEPAYGARPMRRVIQQKIEDLIAKKLLAGQIQKNQPFTIKAEEI